MKIVLPIYGLLFTAVMVGCAHAANLGILASALIGIAGIATIVPLYRKGKSLVAADRLLFNRGQCKTCGKRWRFVRPTKMSRVYKCGCQTRWFFAEAIED